MSWKLRTFGLPIHSVFPGQGPRESCHEVPVYEELSGKAQICSPEGMTANSDTYQNSPSEIFMIRRHGRGRPDREACSSLLLSSLCEDGRMPNLSGDKAITLAVFYSALCTRATIVCILRPDFGKSIAQTAIPSSQYLGFPADIKNQKNHSDVF